MARGVDEAVVGELQGVVGLPKLLPLLPLALQKAVRYRRSGPPRSRCSLDALQPKETVGRVSFGPPAHDFEAPTAQHEQAAQHQQNLLARGQSHRLRQ